MTVEGTERILRKGLIRIVVAADPNIDAESAVAAAAAEHTDHYIRMPAGPSNPRRYIGFRRIAWRRRKWEGEGGRDGEAREEKDGQIEGVE